MKTFSLMIFLSMLSLLAHAQINPDTFAHKEILNLAYLSPDATEVDSLQQLNLVLPVGVENPPLLLWIGGGAWSFVNRHMEMPLARKFAREGIAVASVGHRLSKGTFSPDRAHPEGVKHPAHIEDVAAAFKWLHEHANEYGYDASNIFVGGFSSGGHLSALLGMDSSYLQQHELKTTDIRAIIPVAGAYDINDYHSVFANHENPETRKMAVTHVKDVFGETEEDFTQASPVQYMDQLNIPMLLISEGGLFSYTKVFEEKIYASAYRDCQIFHVMSLGHGGLWRDISYGKNSQCRNLMVDYIRRKSSKDQG